MRMDSTQRGWGIASLAILAASAVVYVFYALGAPQGPRGGSAIGLTFGVVGFAFMIFAALLGARKRVPTWRVGRAQAWMRGHLWLGFLALPIILFHGGFHFGGTLTRVLMWLLMITVFSGVFGAVLQHYIPRVMTSEVPLETIYDEIGHVRSLLREEADRAVESVCGPIGLSKASDAEVRRAGGFTALRAIAASAVPLRTSAAVSAGASAAVAAAPEILLLSEEESAPLRRFYLQEMRPFLEIRSGVGSGSGMRRRRRARLPDCKLCCRLRRGRLLTISRIFATRRGNCSDRHGCITGCTAGCWCIFRCRLR